MFDAGQNSAANFAHLTETGLHYVGSLPPSNFPDLLAIPARRRHPVDPHKYPGLSAYDTHTLVFGADRRVILTHSANLHTKQAAGLDQTLAKTTRDLGELAATLARGKTRREPDAVQAEVARITHPRWVARVLTTQLTGSTPATMRLTWHIDPAARQELETEIFGKRLLVTDHDDWTIAQVVAGYRSQNDVESGFRQLKDPHIVGFSPMFHPTESKIRLHVFYCVLALAVAHLMRRQAHQSGLDLSVRQLLTNLAGIQETRPALPHRQQRPAPSAVHPHRHQPHPETPLRPFRARHLRPTAMTWVIHPATPKTGPELHVYHPTTR